MRTLQLTAKQVSPDDLHPDPANPRRIDDADLDSLSESIHAFGFVDPVIARRASCSGYGWPATAKRQWHGGRDQGDVWTIPRPQEASLHPTQ